MAAHRIVKTFRDYADDIEAVSIHYAVTLIGAVPDWNAERATRYMPLIAGSLRSKELKLPASLPDVSGEPTDHYLLHYYFEICQGGDRHYTQLYSEEVTTEQLSRATTEQGDAAAAALGTSN